MLTLKPPHLRSQALLLTGVIALACSPAPRDTANADVNADSAAAVASDVPSPPSWYSQTRALDLTGDGTLDTLVLRAHGPSSDSLTIVLSAVIDGDSVALETWQSSYELAMAPESVQTAGAARDAFVRATLESTLVGARTEAFADTSLNRAWIPRGENAVCMDDAHDCIMRELRRELRDSASTVADAVAPFDTARAQRIVADLRTTGRLSLAYSYGYESTVKKAWSALTRRFYTVQYCC